MAEYPKTSFPSNLVCGNTDCAALRLVTCGGKVDSQTRNYLDNIVAFASLGVGASPPLTGLVGRYSPKPTRIDAAPAAEPSSGRPSSSSVVRSRL